MNEEEKLQKITRLLEQGCTMLATHHGCGAPLFRCRGEVVCPVCSFGEAESAGAAKDRPLEPGKVEGEEKAKHPSEASVFMKKAGPEAVQAVQDEPEIADLRRSVLAKLKGLAEGMEREQDLDRLRKQLDCIEGALKVLRSMER